MIKKINKLKYFGIFHDFSWPSGLAPFKRLNLIYGWNYSGKTTLSRVFRCFESGQLPKGEGYEEATFELELEDESKYDQSQLSELSSIRVFNSDFIRQNLKWEEGIEPVLLVGEENIQLEKKLAEYTKTLEEERASIKELHGKIEAKNGDITKGLTGKASNIKNTLSLPDYESPNFKPVVERIASEPRLHLLPPKDVQLNLRTYQSTDKKDPILEIDLSMPNLCDHRDQTSDEQLEKSVNSEIAAPPKASLYEQTNALTVRTARAASPIERLKNNPALQEWVREGRALHEGKSKCQFCEKKLDEDWIEKLNGHFSADYENLLSEIEELTTELEKNKITSQLSGKGDFYAELRSKYDEAKSRLESQIKSFNANIDTLMEALNKKKDEMFAATSVEVLQDNARQLQIGVEQVNAVIKKHNEKTTNFETQKEEAKERLIEHWASEFAIEMKYSEALKEVEEQDAQAKAHEAERDRILNEIQGLQERLSDAVKGAERINEYLRSYFGTDEIRMIVAEDKKHFRVERSGHKAENLSEGEETAIAFSHFLAKLEENNNDLSQTIVFIDDPVSSLDCNHLFHTYSFIKHIFADCKQLFISTHNFEFFNLIKEWFNKVKKTTGDKSFYLIEKTKNGEDAPFACILKALPEPLSKFRSEYVYLFSLLYKFNENPRTDYDYLYILPNLVRRYLEAYVGFRTLGGLSGNLSILIKDETQQERVYKLINAYSHNSSNPRLLHFPDFSECKDVVDIVLKAVDDKDKEHYEALVEACDCNVNQTHSGSVA